MYILVTLLIASRVRPHAAMTKLIYHYRYNAGRLQILTCATRQTSKQILLLLDKIITYYLPITSIQGVF